MTASDRPLQLEVIVFPVESQRELLLGGGVAEHVLSAASIGYEVLVITPEGAEMILELVDVSTDPTFPRLTFGITDRRELLVYTPEDNISLLFPGSSDLWTFSSAITFEAATGSFQFSTAAGSLSEN